MFEVISISVTSTTHHTTDFVLFSFWQRLEAASMELVRSEKWQLPQSHQMESRVSRPQAIHLTFDYWPQIVVIASTTNIPKLMSECLQHIKHFGWWSFVRSFFRCTIEQTRPSGLHAIHSADFVVKDIPVLCAQGSCKELCRRQDT